MSFRLGPLAPVCMDGIVPQRGSYLRAEQKKVNPERSSGLARELFIPGRVRSLRRECVPGD